MPRAAVSTYRELIKLPDTHIGQEIELKKKTGLVLVISGPSGVGKDSILDKAEEILPDLCRSISVTTRPMRGGEVDGKEYFFRTPAEFEKMKAQHGFLEWARYLDYYYGTPRAWVLDKLKEGKIVALEIDVQGAEQVKQQFAEAVLVFVLPPNEEALRARLKGRNTETEAALDKRLEAYRKERKHLPQYDYVIVNDVLDNAVDLFRCIVKAECAKVKRRFPNG
jgi:guanylate kinase